MTSRRKERRTRKNDRGTERTRRKKYRVEEMEINMERKMDVGGKWRTEKGGKVEEKKTDMLKRNFPIN